MEIDSINSFSEEELASQFFKKLSDLSKTKKNNILQCSLMDKENNILSSNKIHNFMDLDDLSGYNSINN
jgi:hypothetical protein